MKPIQLYEKYPQFYHIAWGGSWQSISDNGLLSTKCLLELYGKSGDDIRKITRKHRPTEIEINSPVLPRAVIRDQKPICDKKLIRALPADMKPSDWYELLNSMVFFWPTKDRLKKMLMAYQEIEHDVLIINTKKLVELEESNIRLSHINSGSTAYKPQYRDKNLFRRFKDYPFDCRWTKQGRQGALAEVCVVDRVGRIQDIVDDTKHGSVEDILTELKIKY